MENNKVTLSEVRSKEGKWYYEKEKITEIFAKEMSEIFKSEYTEKDFLKDELENVQNTETAEDEITEEEFNEMLKKLSINTSPGISKITGAMIVHATKIHKILFYCFKILYRNAITPDEWKESITRVLFKKGDEKDVNNYRPIALLECMYKAYSTILMIKLQRETLINNKVIHPLQFGFRPEFSISQPIWTLQSVIEDSIEKDKELHILYVDFQKAYDRVEWEELNRVLKVLKLPKRLIEAIKEILSNRYTTYYTPTGVSKKEKISRGLPQGDPTSTILFNIFINTLLNRISNKIKGYKLSDDIYIPLIAFADDLTIITDNKEDMIKALRVHSRIL